MMGVQLQKNIRSTTPVRQPLIQLSRFRYGSRPGGRGVGGGAGAPDGRPAGALQQLVADMANQYWGDDQDAALIELIRRESSWNPAAANPRSSARGLFQKMTSVHGPVEATPEGQANWGLRYIADRYGTPSQALAFHRRRGWY